VRKIERGSLATRAVETAAIGVAYYVTAKLSLRLALVGESVTPLWPPTGIALVAFLWFGSRAWLGVAVAAFLVNLPISPNAAAAAGIAAGNTVAPLIARRLLQALDFRVELDRLRDALALVFAGALAAMTVSATAGTVSLLASGAVEVADFGSTWSVWWTGDTMGILAIAPFLLSIRQVRVRGAPPIGRVVEAFVLFGGIAAASFSLHKTDRPVWVVVFPLLGWVAWRFKQSGAGPAALIVIIMATWAAAHDSGPFADTGSLLQKMVMLQVFNAAVSFTSFFFAAIVAERERAVTERQRSIEREREVQARLYEREHRIAETLQRSLLPEQLPDIPDVHAAARYIPAASELEVGGDWYDIIPMHDGRLGLGIGDVAGHGVGAAAAMGQVRSAFRAYLLEGLVPSHILERLNALLRELLPGAMATLACAQLDPETGIMRVARAGHPPPLLRSADGAVRIVEGGLAPPLGVIPIIAPEEVEVEIPLASTLLFYTDGLIERRRESLDQGLKRLEAVLAAAPDDLDVACDQIVEKLLGGKGVPDDAVLLAIRRVSLVGRPLNLSIPAQPERLAGIRRILSRWLKQNGSSPRDTADILVACTEACANVIQHAYTSKEGSMDIVATSDGGAITVGVRDFGIWMPEASESDGSNRGLLLMRGLMDSVDVVSGPEGTNVLMRRRVGEAAQRG
jgi:serine phosphatase RsbU (regulator of sigma subunit)/integral membrane sensor domain MASE1/anti-sigma regulatory factor (Ser/Thr protein kinase)